MQNAVNQIARELACIETNISVLGDTLADINPLDEVTRRKYCSYIDELKARRDAVSWTLDKLGFRVSIERDGDLRVYVHAPSSIVNVVRKYKKARAA